MTTSPRAALTCWKRLSSSSMCAAGSCEKAPPRRLPSENAPAIIARAIGELSLSVPAAATWSQVARMSRTSSSTASRSTSVIALVRTTFCFCRLRAWLASSVPPTTTSVPPPWNTTSSSPWSRNTDCVAFGRSFSGSLPRGARQRGGQHLEFQHQIVLQHARPERAGALLDLLHGRLDLARLHVRDEDLGIALELGELLGQRLRAEVARDLREMALLVGARGLDDQEFEVADAVHGPP